MASTTNSGTVVIVVFGARFVTHRIQSRRHPGLSFHFYTDWVESRSAGFGLTFQLGFHSCPPLMVISTRSYYH
jgi:hypothetical protein